eukprot:TRINITY_DN3368_c0_g1_i1.p1 TRINITY_DN3368_c0_g1~~TRINITY_DN3368_c0_g1_i1.p1  ORF type:complete len:179 (+),score=47.06 TRINITY_DN3368_c0_g1_i1:51-587(+)
MAVRALRQCDESMLDCVYALEAASYPSNEAATREGMRMRLLRAAPFFRLLLLADLSLPAAAMPAGELPGGVAGFVNGTLVAEGGLRKESMHEHAPEGTTLCIHSVVVHPSLRRRGVARAMLQAYLQQVATDQPQVNRVELLCKENNVGLYSSCGFVLQGVSPVNHGSSPWLAMSRTLP